MTTSSLPTLLPAQRPAWDPGEFFVGANLPWVDYGCDFGASAWFPAGGLAARREARATFDGALNRLGRDQVTVVRLFLLCDCRSGARFDETGVPIGLDDEFFCDAEVAFDAAASHGVRLVPVLFDFHLSDPAQVVDGVQLGGRSRVITDPRARDALITRIVRPVVERFGRHPAVLAWDLCNEPEWCLPRIRIPFGAPAVPFDGLRAWLGDLVQVAQACTPQPVTVGLAGAAHLDLVRGLGLDFYQVHWYERFGWAALADSVDRLRLDRPVLLGEFPGRTTGATPAGITAAARGAGYCGALIWSVLSRDSASGYEPASW